MSNQFKCLVNQISLIRLSISDHKSSYDLLSTWHQNSRPEALGNEKFSCHAKISGGEKAHQFTSQKTDAISRMSIIIASWMASIACHHVLSYCSSIFFPFANKSISEMLDSFVFFELFHLMLSTVAELMLLGFISLLLTVFQGVISNICISPSLSSHMLPCKREESSATGQIHHGQLAVNHKRLLSEGSGSGYCLRQVPLFSLLEWNEEFIFFQFYFHFYIIFLFCYQGKIPLLSLEALHQLHIFIFVLAVVHVIFCATTMVLGGAKVSQPLYNSLPLAHIFY